MISQLFSLFDAEFPAVYRKIIMDGFLFAELVFTPQTRMLLVSGVISQGAIPYPYLRSASLLKTMKGGTS